MVEKQTRVAETPLMTDRRVMACVFLSSLCGLVGCPDGGEFTPNDPDAGFIDEGITAADIGTPCTFDPNSGENPSNQCAGGLECVFVPRDVRIRALAGEALQGNDNTLAMLLPVLEDHFTVYNADGTDTGFCSRVGNLNAVPVCPLGTVLKGFRSAAVAGISLACIKPCTVSAECNAGLVCDARYFDETGYVVQNGQLIIAEPNGTLGYCVRPCEVDFPDCTRTGFAVFDANGTIESQVAAVDVMGGRVCGQSGVCEARVGTGTGTDGDPCVSSADCVDASVCIQQDARGLRPADGVGYCAERCFVNAQTGTSGTCGNDLCQPGLTYGYDVLPALDPTNAFGDLLPAFPESTTKAINGVCLDSCVEGFACRDGLTCAAVDALAMQAAWNEQFMCVPEEIEL
jgi:hypothetical protein